MKTIRQYYIQRWSNSQNAWRYCEDAIRQPYQILADARDWVRFHCREFGWDISTFRIMIRTTSEKVCERFN